jgi:NAD(P)-dependent dehydrogenase (short-subunit alcohol dehydrogenase family)
MTAIGTDVAAVQRMFDINLFGPMRMVRSFHSMIIAAKGSIVNIGLLEASSHSYMAVSAVHFLLLRNNAEIKTSIVQRK